MEGALVKYFLLVFIILLQIRGYESCFEEERMGLLEFKATVKFYGGNPEFAGDAHSALPSWVDKRESNCCSWERVTCNATTGHVIDLSLNHLRQEFFKDISQLYLNFSIFQPFKELRILDLSKNEYIVLIENEGFERLSTLTKLQTLNLYGNDFENSILPSLGALTSLKTLCLRYNMFEGSFPAQELGTLENLEMLDLSENDLTGTLTIRDRESLSRLKKLETLNLGYNSFNITSITQSLSAVASLKNLNLTHIGFEGSFPAQELSILENLETLDLSQNGLNGSLTMQDWKSLSKLRNLTHLNLSDNSFNKEILRLLGVLPALKSLDLKRNDMERPFSNQDLVTFSNLEILDLSENNFIGSIPPFIGELSSLKALSLAQNELNGSLSIQGLCALKKLEDLDLSQNNFEGILPPCLNNLTSLRLLDLSLNQFTGNISSSLITTLTSLEYIDLSHNRFKGLFSFNSFANHAKLEVVEITSDINEFEVETEISGWVPMFQLKVLILSNCKLNKLTGDIPKFLLNQQELRVVDLSHNNLKGRFPNWLLQNNTRLEFLNLRSNYFTGQFRLPPYPSMNTFWIDVSDNQIGGHLQENIGKMVPHIQHLNLSKNTFEGRMPTSICDMRYLMELDLSTNKFSGKVPKQLVGGCIQLEVLILSNNSLHGQIFSKNFSLTSTSVLHLDNNQFTGTLSSAILKMGSFFVLDVSNNFMSGEIQSSIGDFQNSYLSVLILRNNSFKGMFPCELVPNMILDFSHNFFSGSLPSCSKLQYLNHLYLRGNKFTGSLPKVLLNSSNLLTMDIRDNLLSGNIPDLIGGLSNLRVLALGGNHLSGLIPNQLCQLNKTSLIDLSKNFFSGSIPYCFNNISFGKIGINEKVFEDEGFYSRSWFAFYTYGSLLEREFNIRVDVGEGSFEQVEVEFVTKYISNTYKGDILNYMSGLDLSCNKLTGEIPHELGNLSSIHAMNLSHNQLIGSVPTSFSKLTQIESLDLSYNNMSGKIPSELIDLNFLEVFTVAYNNLSGPVPDRKAQFGTFENSSYDGNPFLCGQPLEKSCTTVVEPQYLPTSSSNESKEGNWYEIDLVAFSASCATSYIVFLLGVAIVLYINPCWRRRWFNLIEECSYSCYYCVYDTLHKLSTRFHN